MPPVERQKPKEQKPDPARRSVRPGDSLYYHGPGGIGHARVVCHGAHGVTLDIGGKHTPVRWQHVLGHRERMSYPARIVDHGEDGAVVEEDDGTQTFIEGLAPPEPEAPPPEPKTAWETALKKSLSVAPVPRALFFVKAIRPGLSLEAKVDKAGHQIHRWVKPGDVVKFQHPRGGDAHGEVVASGHVGATVRDGEGVEHQVKHGDYRPHDGAKEGRRGSSEGYGTHDIQPGGRVAFQGGSGKVESVGKLSSTVVGSGGEKREVGHHEITDYKPPAGTGKPPMKAGQVLGKQEPIPADKFVAADYAKSHDQADVTPESVMAEFPPDTEDRIKAAQDRLAGIEQTIDEHKKSGSWNEERKALHRSIMDQLFSEEAVRNATPAPGEKPKFIILGGRGGSGKSSFSGTVYDPKKFIVLDADHIKGMLPEYEGWNAAQVHEESGELFDRAVEIAREHGLNIVQDKTMKTAKSAIADVRAFKSAGYRTEAHYMHLPRQEAAKRAIGRFLGGGANGRYVPVEVVLANTTNESAFDQIKTMVDAWSFRDNNVPKGAAPILISESAGGRGEPSGPADADEKKGDHPKGNGDSFVVYRAGAEHDKDLSGRNAGNANGVANHLARMDDAMTPGFGGGSKATHVHAYRVKLKAPMSSQYQAINRGGAGAGGPQGGPVGKADLSPFGHGDYAYSFPHGGDYEAEHIGSVPIDDVRSHLKGKHGDADEIGDYGTELIADSIREIHGHARQNMAKSVILFLGKGNRR